MLWDCGHTNYNHPSVFLPSLGVNSIQNLFITNYDQDHISDLTNLRNAVFIETLTRNPSITREELYNLKLQGGPITGEMLTLLNMMSDYTGVAPVQPANLPGVSYKLFWNKYGVDFVDSNNISLVTFLHCLDATFLIPGDIEYDGWMSLLEIDSFCRELTQVNVLIASHHGRESGYCEEIFDYCAPSLVVFSDSNIQHATQQTSDLYAAHASGVYFGNQFRRVVTTRNDGDIFWNFGN